jgi:hypothetical protein
MKAKGKLTDTSKQALAWSEFDKGKGFLGAALLLRRIGGDEYVVLHLICQGVEVVLKSLLVMHDYDKYWSALKKGYGHDLKKVANEVLSIYKRKPLSGPLEKELGDLSEVYREHSLRYASIRDIFHHPSTFESGWVLKFIGRVIKLAGKHRPPDVLSLR